MTTSKAVALQQADVSFQQIERMALAAAKSGLFGVKDADQAMALMMIAQAEGMHPALAARDYHIINGKAALKADTMLARFQQSGGRVEWKEYTDEKVVGVFSHPQAGAVTIDWTIGRATNAGLTRNPTWKNYPRAMLKARCISEGVRACFPGVAIGTYTVEEVQDMEPRDITPETRVEAAVHTASTISNALTADDRREHLECMANATTIDQLAACYRSAVKHAREAKDIEAEAVFLSAKDARKSEIENPISTQVDP